MPPFRACPLPEPGDLARRAPAAFWRLTSGAWLSLVLSCTHAAHGEEPRLPHVAGAASALAAPTLARAVAFARSEYEWLHAHPELANQERETAARLAADLQRMGLEVQPGIGGTGFVAILQGKKPGPRRTVLYRAELDALPITEQTKLPYASQVPGVMHACGHDLHMAVAVAALQIMADTRSEWAGTLLFVGQPAEEIGAGARQVLADPAFQSLVARHGKPQLALALHDSADVPAGQVGISSGYVSANVDTLDLTLYGKGGHAAKPHETVDPIVMGAEVVLQLQTIVSRRLPPGTPAVVTVGKLEAGTRANIIPPTAQLAITVRSYDDAVRQKILAEIGHVATKIAESYHAPKPPLLEMRADYTPSGFNDEAWSTRLATRFRALLGAEHIVPIPPNLGGDDFSRYGRELAIPAVLWRLGAADPAALARKDPSLPGLHSDGWAPDVRVALPIGIQTVVAALREAFAEPPQH